jgi:threonine dehydratase
LDDIDTAYVPIGLGSAICGLIGTRDVLGRKTKVVGVVAAGANSYRRSVSAGRVVPTTSALTFADGMAVRFPDRTVVEIIQRGADRIIEVCDDEIAEAIRIIYKTTHNCAEGAGAAALAGLIKEREQLRGRRAAVILSGQNIDSDWLQIALARGKPQISCPSERGRKSHFANHAGLESAQHVSPVATRLLALADKSIE